MRPDLNPLDLLDDPWPRWLGALTHTSVCGRNDLSARSHDSPRGTVRAGQGKPVRPAATGGGSYVGRAQSVCANSPELRTVTEICGPPIRSACSSSRPKIMLAYEAAPSATLVVVPGDLTMPDPVSVPYPSTQERGQPLPPDAYLARAYEANHIRASGGSATSSAPARSGQTNPPRGCVRWGSSRQPNGGRAAPRRTWNAAAPAWPTTNLPVASAMPHDRLRSLADSHRRLLGSGMHPD